MEPLQHVRRTALRLVPLAALALAPLAALAQSSAPVQHSVTLTNGGERHLAVALPASYETTPDARYPVLYVLDGENNLGHAAAVVAYLADAGAMPESIVVGLYGGATRNLDYLPAGESQGVPAGRADLFLQALEDDVIPFVDSSYRTGEFRMISGHSFGGVFVAWAATAEPGLFDVYLTQSPYLDDAIGAGIVDAFEETSDGPTAPAFFFANVGAEPGLAPNVRRIGEILSRDGAPRGTVVEEAGADHMMTRLVGLHDGLLQYFGNFWSLDAARIARGGVDVFQAHVEQIESRMGFAVPLGEAMYQRAVSVLLQAGDSDGGSTLAGRYVARYPGSPTAHFLLGNAYAVAGDRAGAVEAITTAMELYQANPDPQLAGLYPNMKALLARLGGE